MEVGSWGSKGCAFSHPHRASLNNSCHPAQSHKFQYSYLLIFKSGPMLDKTNDLFYNLRLNMESNLKSDKLLDQIGWKLLQELQINGRLSYAELGRRVGLTTPAVVERVKRMEEAGIIVGYHADIDPMKVGMPITAFIRMSVVGDVFTRITTVVKNSPEVVECHRGTGADSFIMKVHVRSVEHLQGLIDRLTPFGTTSTSIVLSSPVAKQEIRRPDESTAVAALAQGHRG